MTKLRKIADLFRLVRRDTRGVTAIEYVVIAAGVAVAVAVAWTLTGTQLSNAFQSVSSGITGGSSTTAVDTSDSTGSTDTASSANDSDSDSDS